MHINFKEWQTELLRQHGWTSSTFLQDIREVLKKFKAEIDQQNFKKMFSLMRDDDRLYYRHVGFITSLILQHDISALKDICIDEHNFIRRDFFKNCSFDEFSNKKLGFDVAAVEPGAFKQCKAKKIDINTKGELFLYVSCFEEIKSNCVINVSASDYIYLYHNVFKNSNLYALKLEAANKISLAIDAICNSTIDTLIIDTPVLRIGGLGNYFDLKQQRRKWGFSIKRLIISKEIIDQWGEEKIFKLFKPNILEIL